MLSRAFDIGCAVGRSTFELARVYDEVLGMDFSQAFIARCQELKMTGQANYGMVVEGELVENKTATIDRDIVSCCYSTSLLTPRCEVVPCSEQTDSCVETRKYNVSASQQFIAQDNFQMARGYMYNNNIALLNV